MPSVIVDMPVKLPAKCSSCSSPYSTDGRKYIDTNIDVQRYGRIYICTLCFNEIAQKLDYVSMEATHFAGQVIQDQEETIEKLGAENGYLRSVITSLSLLGAVDKGSDQLALELSGIKESLSQLYGYIAGGEGSTAGYTSRTDEGSAVHPPTGERDTPDGESGSTESRKGSGPADISAPIEVNI